MKKFLFMAIITIFSFTIVGCQTNLRYSTQVRKITIKTSPDNAMVYQVNPVDKHSTFLGMTPIQDQPVNVINNFSGAKDQQTTDFLTTQVGMINVKIEKEGYKTYQGNLATDKKDILMHRISLEPLNYQPNTYN